MLMDDKEFEQPLEEVINNFVLPNCGLQVNPTIIDKSGVAIPLVLSKPGAGKTSIMNQKSVGYNWGMITIQPALKPIEEYGGIPKFKYFKFDATDPDNKTLGTVWSIPEVIVDLYKLSKTKDLVLFFWDDIHLCGPEHLALMQECFTERAIRGYKLPSNCAIVLAGNPSNKAGFRSLSSAIINRCVRLPVYAKFEDWKNNFAVPNEMHHSIISFLGHPMYTKFFHEEEQVDMPWSSPRQWARLSNFVTSYEEGTGKMMPTNQLLFYATGHVGSEAASQYMRHYEIYSKFDVENAFNDSENFVVPSDELERYIFVFAALDYITSRKKKDQKELAIQVSNIEEKFLNVDESLGLLLLKEILLVKKTKALKIKVDSLMNDIFNELNKKFPDLLKKILDERKEIDDE